jgi:hypothetical protein
MKTTTDQPRGIQWTLTNKLEDLDFADDIVLLSHSHGHMQAKTERLHDIAKTTGLEINVPKTKSLHVNATQEAPITIDDQTIEDVDLFTYLGSIVIKTGGTDEDGKARISKARHAFVTLRPVWRNENLSRYTKLRIFNTNVKSVLLYGSETWRRTKSIDHKLQVFINTCLRQTLRIKWPERISNQDLWQRTRQEPIVNTIQTRKWKWVEHTLRRTETSIPRHGSDWNPKGKRKRGRPALTWRRTLQAELKTVRMTWGEAKRARQTKVETCSTGPMLRPERRGLSRVKSSAHPTLTHPPLNHAPLNHHQRYLYCLLPRFKMSSYDGIILGWRHVRT